MVSHEFTDTPLQASKRYLGPSDKRLASIDNKHHNQSALASNADGPIPPPELIKDGVAQVAPLGEIAMTREDYRQLLVDYEEIEDLTCPICMEPMELD